MSEIKKIKADKLDFSRIANSSSGASNKDFYNSSSIEKEYWGDESGEVSFVPMDDGTYLIEQDGVGMGFTDQKGYEYAFDKKTKTYNNVRVTNNEGPVGQYTDTATRGSSNDVSFDTEINSNNNEKTKIGDLKKEYYDTQPVIQEKENDNLITSKGKMKASYIGVAKENILRNDRAKQWGLGQEIEFNYDGHKAYGHKYMDASTTIFYVDKGIKYWNRYDKNGNLTDVRMDDGKDQTIVFYENGDIVQEKIFPIKNKYSSKSDKIISIGDLKKEYYDTQSVSKNDLVDDEIKISAAALESSFDDIIKDGYKNTSGVVSVGDWNVVAALKSGENSRLYFYDSDMNDCKKLDLGFDNLINSISYDESDNKIVLSLSDGEIKSYDLNNIVSSINGPQSLAFATEDQLHLVETAKNVSSPGGGLCDAWTADVLDVAFPEAISDIASNEGIDSFDVTHRYNANTSYNEWCTSSDPADLKVGMIVAVSTHDQTSAGSVHGHIGIYVGDIDGDGRGDIMDNIGYIRTEPLQDWINFYGNEHSPEPVKWGWRANIDLSK